jgi:dolichol-phosphate mannosyltransferase
MPDSVSQARPALSVVIPARDEEGCILETLQGITGALDSEGIRYEVVVVDDGSTDNTAAVVESFQECAGVIRLHRNTGRHGFGMAVRAGLDVSAGDYVAIMMADGSDSPLDLLNYFHTIRKGYDCVFGSRFVKGGKVIDYPSHKLLLNRVANFFVRMLFGLRYNDVTNAFKCYSREAIEAMQPLLSPHFNLTVEMPLKAIVRGFSYTVVPISWTNRKFGASKLKIKEMGSRYLFIVLYLWLEKYLARGDYHRGQAARGESNTAVAARHV